MPFLGFLCRPGRCCLHATSPNKAKCLVHAAMVSPAERFGGLPVRSQLVLQVFGHDDIKRAVLLMLFGGVHKQTREVSSPSMTACSSPRTICCHQYMRPMCCVLAQ